MRQAGRRTLPPGAGIAVGRTARRNRARPTAASHVRPTDAAATVSPGADDAAPPNTAADYTPLPACGTRFATGGAPLCVAPSAIIATTHGGPRAAGSHAAGPASPSNSAGSPTAQWRCSADRHARSRTSTRHAAAGPCASRPACGGQTAQEVSPGAAATGQTQAATQAAGPATTVAAATVRLGLACRAPLHR